MAATALLAERLKAMVWALRDDQLPVPPVFKTVRVCVCLSLFLVLSLVQKSVSINSMESAQSSIACSTFLQHCSGELPCVPAV